MGNYIADLLRAKYRTDFAISNGGGIRNTSPAKNYVPANTALVRTGTGPLDVTLGDALTVYPFGNQVATTVVTGTNLWAALENGGDGYLNVFSPAKAKVKGALLDVFVDALKADMAAGKVTQVPALDWRVKKVG